MYFDVFLKTFSISSFFCFLYDITINKYRVKKESKKEILKNYKNSLGYVSYNLCVAKLYLDECENYLIMKERNKYNIFFNIFIWLITSDFLFYGFHYIFHTKYLYKFHQIHHQYIYTYGITSIYAHPLDFVATNLVPLSFAPLIFKFNDTLIKNIIIFSLIFTVVFSHGGYDFLPATHLKHHIYRKFNYGLNLSDRLLGTYY